MTTPYHELSVQNGTEEEVRAHLERIAIRLREVHGQAVKRDEINVDRFFAESISDEIELFRAMKTLFTPEDPGDAANLKAIDDRIAAREARLAQEGLVPVKSMGGLELAREIGAEFEHQAFYKLYSKYVHPTGYLINRRTGRMPKINELVVRLLRMNAQQYAIDTLRRVAGAFGLSGQV